MTIDSENGDGHVASAINETRSNIRCPVAGHCGRCLRGAPVTLMTALDTTKCQLVAIQSNLFVQKSVDR